MFLFKSVNSNWLHILNAVGLIEMCADISLWIILLFTPRLCCISFYICHPCFVVEFNRTILQIIQLLPWPLHNSSLKFITNYPQSANAFTVYAKVWICMNKNKTLKNFNSRSKTQVFLKKNKLAVFSWSLNIVTAFQGL